MLHAHVRVARAELRDQVRAEVLVGRAERAEARRPAAQLAHRGHRLARLAHRIEHRFGVWAKRLAGLARHEPAADAQEERHAELVLQASDLLADGRLGEVQLVRRGRERAEASGLEEVLDLLEIHEIDLKALPSVSTGYLLYRRWLDRRTLLITVRPMKEFS